MSIDIWFKRYDGSRLIEGGCMRSYELPNVYTDGYNPIR